MEITSPTHRANVQHAPDVEIAVLDQRGTIVAVNEAWTAFCLYNGGDPTRCGVGVNYLEVCAGAGDDPAAAAATELIGAAIWGEVLSATSIVIPCHAPNEPRWFELIVSPRWQHHRLRGATVMLAQVADVPPPAGPARDEWATGRHDVDDGVIGRIHAAGLSLRELADELSTPAAWVLLDRVANELDVAVRALAEAAFRARRPPL